MSNFDNKKNYSIKVKLRINRVSLMNEKYINTKVKLKFNHVIVHYV